MNVAAKQVFIINRLEPSLLEKVMDSPDPSERVAFEGTEYSLYDLRGLINENQREYGDNPMHFGPGFNNNYDQYPLLKPTAESIREVEIDSTLSSGVFKKSTLLNPNAAATFGSDIKEEAFDALLAFRKSILDQTKDYPPPPPLLYLVQNGEKFPHRTKKSFSLQQGKQKSKKTTELAMEVGVYISQVLGSNDDSIYFEVVEPGVVLFFDNEQGESYAARTMKLIKSLAGIPADQESPLLKYCDLREYSPKQRIEIIHAGVESTPDVKWVIIDGIVDIMEDFMSAEEGHLVITDLLRLCSKYDIHVTGVLHQNKGLSKDARAHVGSIAGQKCEVEVMVERDPEDKSLSVVSAKESRGLPFEDFAIRWEKGGLPYIVQDFYTGKTTATGQKKIIPPSDVDTTTHTRLLNESYYNQEEKLAWKQLTLAVKVAVSGWMLDKVDREIGLNKAEEWVTYWLANGYIELTGTPGTRSAKYSIKYKNEITELN